jgi:hypothetical protein
VNYGEIMARVNRELATPSGRPFNKPLQRSVGPVTARTGHGPRQDRLPLNARSLGGP